MNGVASLVLVLRIFHTQIVPEKKTTSRQRIVWGISCVIVRKEVMSLKEEGTMLL